MRELDNYSIETDHTVLLSFKDGRSIRVPIDQLANYLAQSDLRRVQASMKLRQDFVRQHMPKVALALAAGGFLALFMAGGRSVAHLLQSPSPAESTPPSTGIVRSLDPPPTPSLSPVPQPAPGSTGLTANPLKAKRLAKRRPPAVRVAAHITALPTPTTLGGLITELPTNPVSIMPAPAAGNDPGLVVTPDQPSATPSPSPEVPSPSPRVSPAGQVLGDSTGPGDTPDPSH
jgi:hypothetical protein